MRRTIILLLLTCTVAGVAYAIIRKSLPGFLPAHESGHELLTKQQRAQYYDRRLVGGVDSITIIKHLRELYVYRHDTLLKIYEVALGHTPEGQKHFAGDMKTPEGLYRINGKNPNSSCHKNLGISYPNDADRTYAHKHGKQTGGDIKIHGLPNGQGTIGKAHRLRNWTWGCIGITDEEIDELYNHTPTGVPVLILP